MGCGQWHRCLGSWPPTSQGGCELSGRRRRRPIGERHRASHPTATTCEPLPPRGRSPEPARVEKASVLGPASVGGGHRGLWRDIAQLNVYSHANPRCHVLATSAVQRLTPRQQRDAQLCPCPTCRPQSTQPQGPHVATLAAADIQAPPIASTMRVRGTASGSGAPGLGRRR